MFSLQEASTIRANPKVSTFYQKIRSDNEAMSASGSAGVADVGNALQAASSSVLDTLKGRWSSLMATVQTSIGETIQDAAASLLPFSYPSLVPAGAAQQLALGQRDANVPIERSPLKKQRTETQAASSAGNMQQQQCAGATTHSCVGVTGEKLVWNAAGSLSSACSCLLVLKQVR